MNGLFPQPATVLIVEDEGPIADALAMLVEDLGYRPLIARDGKQALALSLAEAPSLILTDLMMPRMNGAELIAALHGLGVMAGRCPPIILMSAAGLAAMHHVPADERVTKPFDISHMDMLLRRYLLIRSSP